MDVYIHFPPFTLPLAQGDTEEYSSILSTKKLFLNAGWYPSYQKACKRNKMIDSSSSAGPGLLKGIVSDCLSADVTTLGVALLR